MRIPKVYGQSKQTNCPFCEKLALTQNSQKIPVCIDHKTRELSDLKCICGEWLDLKDGKFGPFFTCFSCGAINFNKALEMNPHFKDCKAGMPKQENKVFPIKKEYSNEDKKSFSTFNKNKKEITITSDECDLYFS